MAKTSIEVLRQQFIQAREAKQMKVRNIQDDTQTQKLYKFESGEGNPTLETFIKWCNHMNIEVKLVVSRKN